MKKTLSMFLLVAGAFVLTLNYSCKKKEDSETPKLATLDAQTAQHNSDANNYKNQSDQVNNDINNALKTTPIDNGRLSSGNNPSVNACTDFQMDLKDTALKIVYFHFPGTTTCNGYTRTGDITARLTSGAKWADVGSVLTLDYSNFKIAYGSWWVKFNGTRTLTNLNGNDWGGFVTGTAKLKYKERAFNVKVDFENGLQATWNSARITEWSFTLSTLNFNLKAWGDTTVNGFGGTDSWGVNRFGKAFTTYYSSAPLVSNSNCLWRASSGVLVHYVNSTPFTLTLGVDAVGNLTPNACPPYGFKVAWTDQNGNANAYVFPY